MQAVTYSQYGLPDVLRLEDITKPIPKSNEILVKIHATTVTPVDCSFRSARPFFTRFYTGMLRPKRPILGTELAGEVVATGQYASRYKIGDKIFASPADGFGAHAQYICLPEDGAQAAIPKNANNEEAAAISNGALTALPFLRDIANIQSGQKVLIIGASGSIGTCAVQLAKYFGAEVTGVCSGANSNLVKSLGAIKVIDYTMYDFTKLGQKWDIIFDTVGKSTFSKCKPVLTNNGYYLSTVPTCETVAQMLWTSLRNGKKAILAATGLRPAVDQIKDMEFLKNLIELEDLRIIIDRSYSLDQITEAYRYVEGGHKVGSVVITVGHQGEDDGH